MSRRAGIVRSHRGATVNRPIAAGPEREWSARRAALRGTVAVALALILTGCVLGSLSVQFSIDPHSPQYVPSQITGAMESAGYRKVPFESFRQDGDIVHGLYSADHVEIHYARVKDDAYVARIYFDPPKSVVTIRLDVQPGGAAGDPARAELERIEAVVRRALGGT